MALPGSAKYISCLWSGDTEPALYAICAALIEDMIKISQVQCLAILNNSIAAADIWADLKGPMAQLTTILCSGKLWNFHDNMYQNIKDTAIYHPCSFKAKQRNYHGSARCSFDTAEDFRLAMFAVSMSSLVAMQCLVCRLWQPGSRASAPTGGNIHSDRARGKRSSQPHVIQLCVRRT